MKNKKECVIANEVKQSQTRKGLLRHDVPRNDVCKKFIWNLIERNKIPSPKLCFVSEWQI